MSNNLTDFDPDAMAELSPEVAADLKQTLDRMSENENNAAKFIGAFIAKQSCDLCTTAIATGADYAQITLPTGMATTTRVLLVIVLNALSRAMQSQCDSTCMTLEQAADILGIRLADDTEEEKGGEQDAD